MKTTMGANSNELRVPLEELERQQNPEKVEKKEQVDGKFPAMVVAFIRAHNFFRPENKRRNEIDAEDFLDYVEKRLQSEFNLELGKLELKKLKLEKIEKEEQTGKVQPEPWHSSSAYTKEDVAFVDALISELRDSGYIPKGAIYHDQKVKTAEEIDAVMVPLRAAVMQAVADYGKLSSKFKTEVETHKRNINWTQK